MAGSGVVEKTLLVSDLHTSVPVHPDGALIVKVPVETVHPLLPVIIAE